MKLSRTLAFFLLITSLSFIHCRASAATENANREKLKLTLEVVQAYDTRLPVLARTDVDQILAEAKRMINAKLSDAVEIEFHDNGVKTLDELFKETNYRTTDNKAYQYYSGWKYDISNKEPDYLAIPVEEPYRSNIEEFLKHWDLDSLRKFLPNAQINNYNDAIDPLMETYKSKIAKLMSIKLKSGEILVALPPAPYQSHSEWLSYAAAQNKYDIIITNTLVILDTLKTLYPHAVGKFGKISGSAMSSPSRKAMDGSVIMVNVLEEYGGVPEVSSINSDISRELKNKIIGGFVLAHEFGHSFFFLPDVYDHGDACLMNSSMENSVDRIQGYNMLAKDDAPCKKCRPRILVKQYEIKARLADEKGDFNLAAKYYMDADRRYSFINTDITRKKTEYFINKACEEYKKASNEEKLKSCPAK